MVDKDRNNSDFNKANVGYQVAVDLMGIVTESNWTRFNAMLMTNSIIIGVLGLILTSEKTNPYLMLLLLFIIPVIGIILCILWYFLMWRDYEYHDYYMRSAREFEYVYLQPQVQTVIRGAKFGNGESISIDDGFPAKNLKWDRIQCFLGLERLKLGWLLIVLSYFLHLYMY